MDSLIAFAKGEAARRANAPMRYYDYKRAIERIKEVNPRSASLRIAEDWDWTADEVYSGGEFRINLESKPDIAGIKGSIWGTPTLEMDGEQEDCFTDKE